MLLIVNAVYASEIITGSLVNAKAVAEYIIARQPQEVSLVCMGNGGEHFFDKSGQDIFPEADFYMCVKYNKFPFVIKMEKDEIGFVAKALSL